MLGKHNILNATAAIAVCLNLGVDQNIIKKSYIILIWLLSVNLFGVTTENHRPIPDGYDPFRSMELISFDNIDRDNQIFLTDFESGIDGWSTTTFTGEDLWNTTSLTSHSPVNSIWYGLESQQNYDTGDRVNSYIKTDIDLSSSIDQFITLHNKL